MSKEQFTHTNKKEVDNNPFEKLQERFDEDAYKNATEIVMGMPLFLEKNVSDELKWKVENIRNAIRVAKYSEAIELAEELYQKNKTRSDIDTEVFDTDTLLEKLLSE